MDVMDISTIEELEELALMALDSEVEMDASSWSHVKEPEDAQTSLELLEVDRAIAECMQQDEYEQMEIDLALQGL